MANHLLPPNATPQERTVSETLSRTDAISVPIRALWRPYDCPERLLPWLAWALSVDEWDEQWTEAQKREAIAASIHIHRHKGTVGAMKRALASLGMEIQLVEWHQQTPIGAPYTFRADITLENQGLNDATQARILRLINAAKNARSHLTALRMIGSSKGRAYLSGWEQSFDTVTVQPLTLTEAAVPPSPYFLGATTAAYDTTTVQPL